MRKTYGVTAYNFVFEKIKYNNPNNRYQLYIVLSSTFDYHSMMGENQLGYDRAKQMSIANKFYQLSIQHAVSHVNVRKDVWVCYNDFSVEVKTDINVRTHKKIADYIRKKYLDNLLWDIHTAFS